MSLKPATLVQVKNFFDCPMSEIKALPEGDRVELKALLAQHLAG